MRKKNYVHVWGYKVTDSKVLVNVSQVTRICNTQVSIHVGPK